MKINMYEEFIFQIKSMSLDELREERARLSHYLTDLIHQQSIDESIHRMLTIPETDFEDLSAMMSGYYQLSEELNCKKKYVESKIRTFIL